MPSIKRIIWWVSPLVVMAALFYHFFSNPMPENYHWEQSYDRALMRAQAENKPVLLLASAAQCPACRRLKSETLSHEHVARILADRFILLFLEAPQGREEFVKSGLVIDTAPTLFLLESSGAELSRLEGFHDAQALFDWLGR